MVHVSQLFVYPVKSLGGVALQEAQVTSRGLQYDRRWMLIDEQNVFLTQRKHPQMALFRLRVTDAGLIVYHEPTDEELIIPFQPQTKERVEVKVWDDDCTGTCVGKMYDQWFAKKLGMPCRLLYMTDDSVRPVDPKYAGPDHITSFSDGYPMLMISEASLQDLNSRLDDHLMMQRFRPNIVIGGTDPYFEDIMTHFEVAGVKMYGVKPCARCVMVGVDPKTAISGPEPLKTLARYRRMGHKILFGQNLVHQGEGVIRVGDVVNIKQLGTPPELTV